MGGGGDIRHSFQCPMPRVYLDRRRTTIPLWLSQWSMLVALCVAPIPLRLVDLSACWMYILYRVVVARAPSTIRPAAKLASLPFGPS